MSRLAPVIKFRRVARAQDRLEAASGVAEAVPANDLVDRHEVAVLDRVGVHAGGMVKANELMRASAKKELEQWLREAPRTEDTYVVIWSASLELDDDGVMASVCRVIRDADCRFSPSNITRGGEW